MALRPEGGGGRLSSITMVTTAVMAATVESIDNPTSGSSPPTPEVRHISDYELTRRVRNPHHSQTHPILAHIVNRVVTPKVFAEWSKVNICEEGGDWHVKGSKFSGGLGISNKNWIHYGGEKFSPTGAGATPKQQVYVAMHIQKNPPDQNGCAGSW